MKRSHEVPICLLEESRKFNDFDYALVHLFSDNFEYYNFFVESLKMGRTVILDNSVFELGEAYEEQEYARWIEKLEPTYYIIPDRFEDKKFTVSSVNKWTERTFCAKPIGVVQGETIDELLECYDDIADKVDIIAISFAQPAFEKLFPLIHKDWARSLGRVFFVNSLINKGLLRDWKKHHLLGCSLPQELIWYKNPIYNFLTSIDTSSPVLHTIFDKKYESWGLKEKIKTKLADYINIDSSLINSNLLYYNLEIFKNLMP